MTTLRFIFAPAPAGRSPLVEVLVNGRALIVTTLARAMQYTAR